MAGVCFDEAAKVLTVAIDFAAGSRFTAEGVAGEHPVHDSLSKRYRHLNFFQHECVLAMRTPRVKLPDGSVRLVAPAFAGKLSGFTLLFEALVLMLSAQMPFAAVARIVGLSPDRVLAVRRRYVALALEAADFSAVKALAIDETSRARGHDYITLAADALARKVVAVAGGRDAWAVAAIAGELARHGWCRRSTRDEPPMRGTDSYNESLFTTVWPEDFVSANRAIAMLITAKAILVDARFNGMNIAYIQTSCFPSS